MLGHFADGVASELFSRPALATLVVAVVVIGGLVIEHRVVRDGGWTTPSPRPLGLFLVMATASLVLVPAVGARQNAGDQLPDLISDPPRPSFLSEQRGADGSSRLLLTFDGYVHNIGDGPLDVVGNPQVPGGMVQRVRSEDGWREVATPTVRYETDDGHNHFHLIEAVDYVLWNVPYGSQTAVGSKIGFCLVDSEQMEPGTEQAYSEELDNFCQENNPGATSLRMGISPGWRDIYDATTTLQWVDVSELAPGRYWIGAITDPNDEIVESDETNNDLVFADLPAIVPGFTAQPTSALSSDGGAISIELPFEMFGDVSTPVWRIESGPLDGQLDVPIGVDLTRGTVTYWPNTGYGGLDSFVFSVRDGASQYPLVAPTAEVSIDVIGPGVGSGLPSAAPPTILASSTFFEFEAGTYFEELIGSASESGAPALIFASGLPAGLTVDAGTGFLTGSTNDTGIFEATLIAVDVRSSAVAEQPITVIVNASERDGLVASADRSSAFGVPLQLRVGQTSLGSTFEASGLPPGLDIEAGRPVVIGTPTEVGTYDVELRQLDGDDVVRTVTFSWTIRPSAVVTFAL